MSARRNGLESGSFVTFGNPLPPSEKPLQDRCGNSEPNTNSRAEIFYRCRVRKFRMGIGWKPVGKGRHRTHERRPWEKDARSPIEKRRTDGSRKNGRIPNRSSGLGVSNAVLDVPNAVRMEKSRYERRSNAATASEAATRKTKSTPTAFMAAEGENSKNDTARIPPHTAGNATTAEAAKAAAE